MKKNRFVISFMVVFAISISISSSVMSQQILPDLIKTIKIQRLQVLLIFNRILGNQISRDFLLSPCDRIGLNRWNCDLVSGDHGSSHRGLSHWGCGQLSPHRLRKYHSMANAAMRMAKVQGRLKASSNFGSGTVAR